MASRRTFSPAFIALATLFILYYFISKRSQSLSSDDGPGEYEGESDTPHLVVAALKDDDVSWIKRRLPTWQASVYRVNDPKAEFTVPLNKGREAMVYLT